jgi:hypothetical protein
MEDNNSRSEQSDDDDNNSDRNNSQQQQHKHNNRSNKCETLDEGMFAFMHWLNSENKKSLSSIEIPIVLLKFVNDKHTILYDTKLHTQVDVEINKGIPYCKYCKEADCAHVGFAVCVEQLYGHRRSGREEERIEDILEI